MNALLSALAAVSIGALCRANPAPAEIPLVCAVLDFESDDGSLKETCAAATSLLQSKLAGLKSMILVERSQLGAVLGEQELSLSGKAPKSQAVRTGLIIGADVIVLGCAMKDGDKIHLSAKIISTSNGRTFGAGADIPENGDPVPAVDELSRKLSTAAIDQKAALAGGSRLDDVQAGIVKSMLKESKAPKVFIGSSGAPNAAVGGIRRVLEKADIPIANVRKDAEVSILIAGAVKASVRQGEVWFCRSEITLSVSGGSGQPGTVIAQTAACVGHDEKSSRDGAFEKAGILAAASAIGVRLEKPSSAKP